jgi:hypothetical protein
MMAYDVEGTAHRYCRWLTATATASVMVLRNSRPDTTRFSAALSMVEIFRSGRTMRHAKSGSYPILAALFIEVVARTLDCSAVGLSPHPEHV